MSASSARNHPDKVLTATAGARFSPGPWVFVDEPFDEEEVEVNSVSRIENSKNHICRVPVGYSEPHESEQRANAHLIAAAPDMYEALKAFATQNPPAGLTFKQWVRSQADRLIAKAEGR